MFQKISKNSSNSNTFFPNPIINKFPTSTSYIIYHNGKTYPHPLLIETLSSSNPNNNNVLALSGTNSITSLNQNEFLSIYNSKGEKISSDENGIKIKMHIN